MPRETERKTRRRASVQRVAPALAEADEASARWRAHPPAVAAPLIRDCLGSVASAAAELIVVSDAEGMILWIEGPEGVRLDAAEWMHVTEDAGWSEGGTGTNAIGTAPVSDHAEHVNEVVQEWTRSAAPVHDPDTGRLLGSIGITGGLDTAHPYRLGCAMATARAVEYHLRRLTQERDARLRARYEERILVALPSGGGELTLPSGVRAVADPVGDQDAFVVRAADGRQAPASRPGLMLRLLRRDQARVELDGRPLPLSGIRTEILALLAARPEGMTSEELAADLYGDDGRPSAVRVQIFRLRKLLGPWIDTAPYRLTLDVDSDVAHVARLLDRGAVREAAECYDGPLLPRSEAPGVVRERDALETWLRQAVMTSDDPEALWAWAQSSSGSDDLAAWKRLLANLDYSDPRRSLAASRVHTLRAAYAAEAPWTAAA